jgi:tRNA1Val (adenine37-N6)-methyltransferase
MPNPYFQFKQFTVFQENAGLKVSTDSCLLGAFTANKLAQQPLQPRTVLDIGTGTGLLMLMLAQKTSATIHGLEIQAEACLQTQKNIMASPWQNRLQVFHTSAQLFAPPQPYDFIICNPPFFQNNLKPTHLPQQIAKHNDTLSLSQLLQAADAFLSVGGSMSLLLPYDRIAALEKTITAYPLFIASKLLIRSGNNLPYFRCIFWLGRTEEVSTTQTLTIKENESSYSPAFIHLLNDYYLYL